MLYEVITLMEVRLTQHVNGVVKDLSRLVEIDSSVLACQDEFLPKRVYKNFALFSPFFIKLLKNME